MRVVWKTQDKKSDKEVVPLTKVPTSRPSFEKSKVFAPKDF